MTEIYKPIQNYENLYEVSNLGNVRSLDRYNIDKNGKKKFYPGKLLRPDSIKKAHTTYYRVALCKNHIIRRYSIHRLVAQTFLTNPDNKPHVNHIDNDGTNNVVENLEWCTHSENMQHAQKQGRLYHAQSKAGKTLGTAVRMRIQNKIESLENTKVGDWSVGRYIGTVKASDGNNHYMFRCTCACGYVQDIEMNRLLKKRTMNCRTCGVRKNTIQAVEKLVKTSPLFTGKYILNDERSPNIRLTLFEVLTEDRGIMYISWHLVKKLIS